LVARPPATGERSSAGNLVMANVRLVWTLGSRLSVLRKGMRERQGLSLDPLVTRRLQTWIALRGRERGPLFLQLGKGGRMLAGRRLAGGWMQNQHRERPSVITQGLTRSLCAPWDISPQAPRILAASRLTPHWCGYQLRISRRLTPPRRTAIARQRRATGHPTTRSTWGPAFIALMS
jgi:hypothetical protein